MTTDILNPPAQVLIIGGETQVVGIGVPAAPPLAAGDVITTAGTMIIGGPDDVAVGVPSILNADAFDTLQEAVDAAAGRGLYIPDGTRHIDDAVTVPSYSNITIAPGATIIQDTINRPVFDCYGVTDVNISGTGWLRYDGDRTFSNAPGSFRAGGWHEYLCGVYIADCSRIHVDGPHMYGWEAGVTMRGWNGALASYLNKDCTIENLNIDTCEFGVLFGGFDGLTLRNIRGTYVQRATGANVPPPAHMLYGTGTASELSRGLNVDGIYAYDGVGSLAFQFKWVRGGSIRKLYARNCPATFKLTDCQDITGGDIIGDDDQPGASEYSVRIESDGGTTARINLNNIKITHGIADRDGLTILGDDVVINDFDLTAEYTTDTADSIVAIVDGTGHVLNRPILRNIGVGSRIGIIATGSGVSATVNDPVMTNVDRAMYADTGATLKGRYNPDSLTYGSGGSQQRAAAGPGTLALAQEPRARTLTVSTPGLETYPDADKYDYYILNLTTTGTHYLKNPLGARDNARLTFEVRNNSGGASSFAWDGTQYIFRGSAPSNPATGGFVVVSFRFDGTNWQEVSRAG